MGMMDSNMVLYIVVCAVMLFAAVLVSLDNIKTISKLEQANTSIAELRRINAELEMENKSIKIQKTLVQDERDGDYQTLIRLQKENDKLKSIRPVGDSLIVPLYEVTVEHDNFNAFKVSAVINGINEEHRAEFIDMLMSKRIAVRKAEEVKE